MKTLIITSSQDVTVDLLIKEIGEQYFIRLNYDRPKDWAINLSAHKLEISSACTGIETNDRDISKVVWRKPFLVTQSEQLYEEEFFREEWKFLLYEIYAFLDHQGKRVLNPPLPDFLFSKHRQIRAAYNFFVVPEMVTTVNIPLGKVEGAVAKSLSGKPFSDGRVLYTVDVSGEILDDSIWTIQKKCYEPYDLTVAYVKGQCFAFRLERASFDGIDWRKDVMAVKHNWEKINLPSSFNLKIKNFMHHVQLDYGRLDFLCNENIDKASFLEVNRNGQWAWLDLEKKHGLFDRMIDIYSPISGLR